jgi:adenylyl- and sulfurtransferase ThiI
MEGVVIVRTGGEIGIKSRPVRRLYESLLLKIIRGILKDEGIKFSKIWRTAGRIYVNTTETERVARRIARIFGVSSTSPGVAVMSELETIIKSGTDIASRTLKPGTFAVRCRRTGNHLYSSVQVAAFLGRSILDLGKGLKVDLTSPQQEIFVEIRDDLAIIYSEFMRGPDGFPVGTQEMLLAVVDETVESVLASWCMMKRGAQVKTLVLEGKKGISHTTLANLRTLASWMPANRIRTIVIPSLKKNIKNLQSFQLLLALHIAKSKQIGGVISGLQPNLKSLQKITKHQVGVFFPLIVIDKKLLERWSEMVGIDSSISPRYDKKVSIDHTLRDSALEKVLLVSKEIMIRAD